jgi:hypothetical protein
MEQTKKSHFGLGFFVGFITTLVVLVAAVGITGYVLYQQYEPTIATKEEELLEDYTSAIVSAKAKITVKMDYKYVDWSTEGGTYYLTAHGIANVDPTTLTSAITDKPFALKASIPQNDYNDIESNLTKEPVKDSELKTNYGAKGIYFIANALGEKTTVFKSLTVDTTAWSL